MIAQATPTVQATPCPRGCGHTLELVTLGGKVRRAPVLVCPNEAGCLGPLPGDDSAELPRVLNLPLVAIAPASNTPERRALDVAIKAARLVDLGYNVLESRQVPGLSLVRNNRHIEVRFGSGPRRFTWTYFIHNGQAVLLDCPVYFHLSAKAQSAVDAALRAYAWRMDGIQVAA